MSTVAAPEAETPTEEVTEAQLSTEQKRAVASAARAFSGYGETRKAMAKIGKAIVNLRLQFEKDGRPDYRGETPQYRGAIASLYEAAIHDPVERETFKVAIRYWVAKEYAARVDAGALNRAELEAAGIMRAVVAPPIAAPREPRRAKTQEQEIKTGVTVDGVELTPGEVMVEAERVVLEHVADASLGPVIAMQSVARTLGPIVAGLRNEDIRSKLPGRSLRQASESILMLALDAAFLSGIEVEDFIASWHAHAEEAGIVPAEALTA